MIETERLRCEPLAVAHADAMFELLADERIHLHLPGGPPASVEALRRRYEFLSGGLSPDGSEHWLNWILILKATGRPAGYFQATVRAASCSIAYVLGPAHWRQGLAREASVALVTRLFERFELPGVRAEINPSNEASLALVRRLGLRKTGFDAEEGDEIHEISREGWQLLHGTPA